MKNTLLLSLICALALSGCAKGSGVRPLLECPQPQPLPEELTRKATPDLELKMRLLLLESPETATEKSDD